MGREYVIKNKRIDVLLEKQDDNSLLIIELKAGVATPSAFAQISEYMGLLRQERPGHIIKGVIIAAEISDSLRLAVSGAGVTSISLQTYKMNLELSTE